MKETKMKVEDLIREFSKFDPETEVKFFTYDGVFLGESVMNQLFVEDISAGKDCLEILLG